MLGETMSRLLSPAEVREMLGRRQMEESRLARDYLTAIAAITAFGAWIPFLENIDIRGVQDDADYDEFTAALRTLAALAQQLGGEG
jgi:hypothetical protein